MKKQSIIQTFSSKEYCYGCIALITTDYKLYLMLSSITQYEKLFHTFLHIQHCYKIKTESVKDDNHLAIYSRLPNTEFCKILYCGFWDSASLVLVL